MEGKTVLITGSTSGLGLEAARVVHERGATVLLTCRDEKKGRAAIEHVQGDADSQSRIQLFTLDLMCYRSILSFCKEVLDTVDKIDVLICNAGIMGVPFELSSDGVESHFATNQFGHFVIANQLFPLLEKAAGRVVVVSSGLYKKASWIPSVRQLMGESTWDYEGGFAYAFSKLANCLWTVELDRRLRSMKSSVKVYALRPGFVRGTELGRSTHWLLRAIASPLIWAVSKSLTQGVDSYLHCAMTCSDELNSGCMYNNCCEEDYSEMVTEGRARQLWDMCSEMEELVLRRSRNLPDEEKNKAREARDRIQSV